MHPMFLTLHTGHTGVEIGLMLKEIHVPPDMLPGVMYQAFRASCLGIAASQYSAPSPLDLMRSLTHE